MHTTWRPLAALLLALALAAPATARQAPKDTDLGRVVKGDHGTYYFPAGARGHEPWPVLIVEKGLADGRGKLWPVLAKRMKVIVVETRQHYSVAAGQDGGKTLRRVIDAALHEASNYHWRLVTCPWIPVGFSSIGTAMAQMTFSHPGRFQGLLLLNSGCEARELPADLADFAKFPVRILHSRDDPMYPAKRATAVEAHLAKAGLDAGLTMLEGDHLAPLKEAGAEPLAAFLRLFDRYQTDDVLEPRWFDTPDGNGRITVRTKAADGLKIHADLYETGKPSDPIVLLFHQARSSRGEYRLIAPRLVKAGFNCLAIDQRVGEGWGGVRNETAAGYGGKKDLGYVDAKPDLERAMAWVRELGFTGKLAIVGSSYSAALVVFLAAENAGIDAVVLFSPGPYLKLKGTIHEAAKWVREPVLVVAPKREEDQARKVVEALGSDEVDFVILPKGVHGASTLYRSPQGESAWTSFLQFLRGTLQAP